MKWASLPPLVCSVHVADSFLIALCLSLVSAGVNMLRLQMTVSPAKSEQRNYFFQKRFLYKGESLNIKDIHSRKCWKYESWFYWRSQTDKWRLYSDKDSYSYIPSLNRLYYKIKLINSVFRGTGYFGQFYYPIKF